ncbi:uncharacterized protein Tco025E_05935 [Trypanosoma conorhini]|uniref:Uncharacterized protein n=1 Tax=Trypanosoma conorhini TaxID=83891 RepID=A0A422P901_9TRYP|nr:uncharacterized protein Tco025E_05935 [Trypanosoma conorhini]RNF14184.1 hypothetical protein Tco025E_05935 [Trypanosoma conorhini]
MVSCRGRLEPAPLGHILFADAHEATTAAFFARAPFHFPYMPARMGVALYSPVPALPTSVSFFHFRFRWGSGGGRTATLPTRFSGCAWLCRRRGRSGFTARTRSSPPHMQRGGVTAADLMELQEAASRLRSLCAQREAENRSLTQLLRDQAEQLLELRADQLLLQKTASMWSSYHRLFAQPLFETRLALGTYQCEAQQLLIHDMLLDQRRRNSLAKVGESKREREKAALQAQVRQLQEQQDSNKRRHAAVEVRLGRASEESVRAQQRVSTLEEELTHYMRRLEESERERERVQRHLSQHEAALLKTRHNVVELRQYEEEIHSRDAVIVQLQQAIREMNALMAQQQKSHSETADGANAPLPPPPPPHEAEERQLSANLPSSPSGACDSERRLYLGVQRLRQAVEGESSPSTHRRPLFAHCSSSNYSTASLPASPWKKERGDVSGIDMQEFLAQELQAPLP